MIDRNACRPLSEQPSHEPTDPRIVRDCMGRIVGRWQGATIDGPRYTVVATDRHGRETTIGTYTDPRAATARRDAVVRDSGGRIEARIA
jgi:hypothetical protein